MVRFTTVGNKRVVEIEIFLDKDWSSGTQENYIKRMYEFYRDSFKTMTIIDAVVIVPVMY